MPYCRSFLLRYCRVIGRAYWAILIIVLGVVVVRLLVVVMGLMGLGLDGDAWAGWVRFQELPLNAGYYINPKSLQVDTRVTDNKTPYRIKTVGWYLMNFPDTGTAHKSVLYQIEDDCLESKHRVLTTISFSEPMGRGYPNFVSTAAQPWINKENGQFEANRWVLSCSNKEETNK